jgi:hypothetical protein
METLKALRTFVGNELKEGLDFGTIPGTAKPTLYLPGAQKIGLYFNVRPSFKVRRSELGAGHLEVFVVCHLITRTTQEEVSEGVGSCSTMESKYRYRGASRACPACGAAAIIKGKEEYGGGWLCHKKQGGCGAKYRDKDPAIIDQHSGKVENVDIWDVRNTVLKMAKKRAQVDASLTLSGLTEQFTQDLEDVYDLRSVQAGEPAPDPSPSDDGRRAVNEAFKPRQDAPAAKPAEAPAPAREPARGRQGPPDTPFGRWLSATAAKANGEARDFFDAHGVPAKHRVELASPWSIVNASVTTALEYVDPTTGEHRPLIDPGAVGTDADPTKRDNGKAWKAAEWMWGKWRDWYEGAVGDHLAAKLETLKGQYRVSSAAPEDEGDPGGDYPPEPGANG